jgi:hypothetical protein
MSGHHLRRVLPETPLFVVTLGPASLELVAVAEIVGARLLPEASAAQVRDAVLAANRRPIAA